MISSWIRFKEQKFQFFKALEIVNRNFKNIFASFMVLYVFKVFIDLIIYNADQKFWNKLEICSKSLRSAVKNIS